jgi:hypothetical protein
MRFISGRAPLLRIRSKLFVLQWTSGGSWGLAAIHHPHAAGNACKPADSECKPITSCCRDYHRILRESSRSEPTATPYSAAWAMKLSA